MTHTIMTTRLNALTIDKRENELKKSSQHSCDCISTFQVEVEDFDNEIFVLSVEAHDKEEASTIAERICAESEITVYNMLVYSF